MTSNFRNLPWPDAPAHTVPAPRRVAGSTVPTASSQHHSAVPAVFRRAVEDTAPPRETGS